MSSNINVNMDKFAKVVNSSLPLSIFFFLALFNLFLRLL